MFNVLQTPVIIGHRGASRHAPENTLAAFNQAIQVKADAIEFDVKLTADRKVVVFHDQKVDRTTNGHGMVSDMSLMDLKQLDAGGWYSTEYKGETIPTLEEVFNLIGNRMPMNIELTNYTSPADGLTDIVVEIVKKYQLEDQVFFSSYLSNNLRRARMLLPGCGIGYIVYGGMAGWIQRIMQSPPPEFDTLNPAYKSVTKRMLEREHNQGRKVLAYTVNQPDDMNNLFKLGIDGIFTDDPMLGKQLASKYQRLMV